MKKITFLLFALMLFASCSTKKIVYFQDMKNGGTVESVQPRSIRIKPGDKLAIHVNSKDEELVAPFNLRRSQESMGSKTDLAYTVDQDGNIDFPYLGTITVKGMTRNDVARHIKQELLDRKMIKDPTVIVDFTNLQLSVLGEVNKPGRYAIEKDVYTIIDAISDAGDLTINGLRENIMVLREENGMQKSYTINMNDAAQLYNSPAYYLQQNDVVYVEPNKQKIGQSTINGNTFRSTSFWMSFTSFILTLVTFFTR